MQILFDYQAFELQRIGGVSRSYAEIISNLAKMGQRCIVGVKESDNVYLKGKAWAGKVRPQGYFHRRLFEGEKLFKGQRHLTEKTMGLLGYGDRCQQMNRDYCVKLLEKQRFDVFEPTFFDSYFLPYLKGKPFVMTVHDMIPELFPDSFSREDFQIIQKRNLCPKAAHIHVPSEKTKEDLVNILGISPEKVTVVPHGSPKLISEESLRKPHFGFPYILYVGDRFGYKNFGKFIKECSYIIGKQSDVRVVCTGKPFSEQEEKLVFESGIADKVENVFASEELLQNLYRHALAFVYPSSYEGFGIPILEAFVCGCPVMLNSASCFPEIAGDAAVYFDMEKDGDLYEKFVDFYTAGTEDREGMIHKGRQRSKLYSWDKAAAQMVAIYDSLS